MAQLRDSLQHFSPPVREWFERDVGAPTRAQALAWPAIRARESTLLLAPTGSGKTLAAFLSAIDRLMFETPSSEPATARGVSVLYISPLKALGSDIQKNLHEPLRAIAERAQELSLACQVPSVGIRTGDSTASERARLKRTPPDILITTPESLYLMLTSAARAGLASVHTVIVDEIHALVPTKRGAHLALSLERLERLTAGARQLQRIGLSATQTPLPEIARFLGGFEASVAPAGGNQRTAASTENVAQQPKLEPRPVTIIDAGSTKELRLSVEMPSLDSGFESERQDPPSGPAARELRAKKSAPQAGASSLWTGVHRELLGLIREHRSTMIFVNNRGLSERLAGALNELADEELCLAHHGSVSKERRRAIEDRLKSGELRAIVATSSLELGIDVGAVELVVQIEAPPSIASALQRIGRSGHQVGATSKGVIFPKYRADLLACAAAVPHMRRGQVEKSRYPRYPLDVLAQQIVAICSLELVEVNELYRWVRGAAPFAELGFGMFCGVLDMLSGKYSDLSDVRARLVWDRKRGLLRARQGAQLVAVTSGGTIPDRGLFGVFMLAEKPVRVGELDEEMVFESRVGDVFVLGASSWRIQEITHDRVLVTPAPAEVGRLPFWRGDTAGRPAEFGRAIGALTRRLAALEASVAIEQLVGEHALREPAARALVDYLERQRAITLDVPSDEVLVVERFVDEVGDHRVCVLSPYGTRVHGPWAIAVESNFARNENRVVEATWYDDGIVFRVPGADHEFDTRLLFPEPDEVEELLIQQLGSSALFASRFRENAMRALLLPRQGPGRRTPLWAQRKRAARLLGAAQRHPEFPIVLETYRECLKDVFDMDELSNVLGQLASGAIRVRLVDSQKPSPFSASLLFAYAGNFVYDRDAPLAERKANVLSLNQSELREVLGEAELRQLLDPAALGELSQVLSGRKYRVVKSADTLADALLGYGDASQQELEGLCDEPGLLPEWLHELTTQERALELGIAGERRFVAIEDAARYRDALDLRLPCELPAGLGARDERALVELVARYARSHVPFVSQDLEQRFGKGHDAIEAALEQLLREGRLERGNFLPNGATPEWCDRDVLKMLKRRSLEALRREIEPVPVQRLTALLLDLQRVTRPRSGLEGLLSTLEQLEGVALTFGDLEDEVLRARVGDLAPGLIDRLVSSGELVWRGLAPIGQRDGRIAFFLSDRYALLAPPRLVVPGTLAAELRELLSRRGASFFHDLVRHGQTFAGDVLKVLWQMVWAGEVTNDTLAPLRSLRRGPKERPRGRLPFRSRRESPQASEGRWSLLPEPEADAKLTASSQVAWAELLVARHGIVTRETLNGELCAGGFSNLASVLRALEERARVRRGYFVQGLSGQQFAALSVVDRLRRPEPAAERAWLLAATDPANPYGSLLGWPEANPRPQRASGSKVLLAQGKLLAYASKGFRQLATFLDRGCESEQLAQIAELLAGRVREGRPRVMLVERVDGEPAKSSPLCPFLLQLGFCAADAGSLRKVTTPEA